MNKYNDLYVSPNYEKTSMTVREAECATDSDSG